MPVANRQVKLFIGSPVVARIALSYSAEVQEVLSKSEFENAATVNFNLYDTDHVTKLIDTLSCPYIASSNGVYGAISASNPALVLGSEYRYEFIVVAPGSQTQAFGGHKIAERNAGS